MLFRSQTQQEIENQLLNLIICIEAFLTPKEATPIGTAIAEGVAIILATGLDRKIRLKKRIKEIYGMRSAISHGGRKAILQSDLEELRSVAGDFIMTMISRKEEFKSRQDLLVWIETQKFG